MASKRKESMVYWTIVWIQSCLSRNANPSHGRGNWKPVKVAYWRKYPPHSAQGRGSPSTFQFSFGVGHIGVPERVQQIFLCFSSMRLSLWKNFILQRSMFHAERVNVYKILQYLHKRNRTLFTIALEPLSNLRE